MTGVLDEFMLQLHRRIVEYEGMNGDYLGEELHWEMGKQGYFHFLGFLDRFSERYEWEPGIAHEYLARLWSRQDWMPFTHQLEGWQESTHYGRHVASLEATESGSK